MKDDHIFGALSFRQEQMLQAVDMQNAHLEEESQHIQIVTEGQNGKSDEEAVLYLI